MGAAGWWDTCFGCPEVGLLLLGMTIKRFSIRIRVRVRIRIRLVDRNSK